MKTVNETARLAHVSVRTLHHYDAIGLLRPTTVTESGYRLYDEDALRRLQTILLLRQLREEHPLAKETLRLLTWNGGGANSSGRGIANTDPQGNIHPDQFWQSVNVCAE